MPGKRSEDWETPRTGSAGAGKPFVPADSGDEESPDKGKRRPAPPPRTPLTEEEYERLKKAAETEEGPPCDAGQEDPSED